MNNSLATSSFNNYLFTNIQIYQVFALHMQLQIMSLDAKDDSTLETYDIKIVYHIPQQYSHLSYNQ
jgi:hypothetical protein